MASHFGTTHEKGRLILLHTRWRIQKIVRASPFHQRPVTHPAIVDTDVKDLMHAAGVAFP
jgi:hypothetical protein